MIVRRLEIRQVDDVGSIDLGSSHFGQNSLLPVELESRQYCQLSVIDKVKEIYGLEIDLTVVFMGPMQGTTVLRILAGGTYFTEIDIPCSGTYRATGRIPLTGEKSLMIGLADVWPTPFTRTRVVVNAIRVDTLPLGIVAPTDWVETEIVETRFPLNWSRILGSIDPLGVTVEDSTTFTRYIRRNQQRHFENLTESGHLDELLNRGLLAPFSVGTTTSLRFPACVQVVKGLVGKFTAPSQLKAILQCWLSIDHYLATIEPNFGCLIDFNQSNFAEIHSNDWRLIDFGSIQPSTNLWTGIDGVVRDGLALLKLQQTRSDIAWYHLNHFWTSNQSEEINRDSSLGSILDWLELEKPEMATVEDRRNYLRTIESWINNVNSSPKPSFWSNYAGPLANQLDTYQNIAPLTKPTSFREDVIASILQSIGGGSLIDLGSASGRFTALASRLGFEVLAVDQDIVHVEQILATACAESSLTISARILGLTTHSFKSFVSLYRADTVLCLALTHHLLLADHTPVKSSPIPISMLCEFLGSLARSTLLVEFMPLGLASPTNNFKPHPSPLPKDYSCEIFVNHLMEHFAEVSTIEYQDQSHRLLLVCKK